MLKVATIVTLTALLMITAVKMGEYVISNIVAPAVGFSPQIHAAK